MEVGGSQDSERGRIFTEGERYTSKMTTWESIRVGSAYAI